MHQGFKQWHNDVFCFCYLFFIFLRTRTPMKPPFNNVTDVIAEFSFVLSFVLHFRKEEVFLVTREA